MKTTLSHKTKNVFEVLLFVLVVVLDAYGVLPISQTVYLVPIIFIILKFRKEKFASIGWEIDKYNLWKNIAIGVLIGIVMELFAIYALSPFINGLAGTEPDLSQLSSIKGNVAVLGIYLLIVWVLGAFGEEICFRGFLMNRIAAVFNNTRIAWVLAIILSSILFGWGHTEQGISGWIQEGINALILGSVFVFFDKKLVIPIVAHGISNTLALVMIYLGLYPGLY